MLYLGPVFLSSFSYRGTRFVHGLWPWLGLFFTWAPPEEGKIKQFPFPLDLASGLGEVEDALNLVQRLRMSTARGMENLRLESNPWVMPPEAVVEEGLPAVVEYLTDVRTAEETGANVKELKLLKVVLVGSSQAGKTRCLPA